MTKDQFLATTAYEGGLEHFEAAAEAARILKGARPGIGLWSSAKKARCFIGVCEFLDEFVEGCLVQRMDTELVLAILRASDRTFRRASEHVASFASRLDAAVVATWPRSAQDYLQATMMRRPSKAA